MSEPKNVLIETAVAATAAIGGTVVIKKNMPDKYLKALAIDLSKELNKKINPLDLKSIITIQEFKKITKSLKEENYISSPENIKNGIFRADFHSHSDFSDGASSVEDILNQAAEYGNKLQKINGKKFLFALSDHDGIEGVKEALKIIAENPKKFQNVRFITASELSMPITCEIGSSKHNAFHNDVEMVELLIYGINPFSPSSEQYFKNLYRKRKEGVKESLKKASEIVPDVKFLEEEYNRFFTRKKVTHCMLNQHWRIFNYINLKTRIAQIAKEQNKNPEELYANVMKELRSCGGYNGAALDEYLKRNGINNSTKTYADTSWKIANEICPKYKGPILYAPYESSFENIVTYAEQDNAVLAFAHPGFTIQNMRQENALQQIKNYIDKSKGRLIYSETYHQAYPPNNISKEEIEEANKIMEEAGLINLGGRDMHKDNFKL